MRHGVEHVLDRRPLPGCGHCWAMTQCLSCRQTSPHEQWYYFPPPEDGEARETKKSLETTR